MSTRRHSLRSPSRSVVALLALLAGCGQSPEQTLTFRLGAPELPSTLLLYVAQDADLFAKERLKLELVRYDSGREALQAAAEGLNDAAVVYSTPVVLAALRGEDIVILSTLHRADGLTGVAVSPGSKIRTASQLRGHRVGVTPQTTSQLALDVLLAEGGLGRSDVQVVDGNQRQLISLLQHGEIDAASLWVPNLFAVTRPDAGSAHLVTSDVYSEMSMLAGVRHHLERRKTETTRLLRALLRAQELVRAHPDLVFTTLRPRFPQLGDDDLALIAGRSRFELGLSNLLISSLRQEAAWLEQRGVPRSADIRLRDLPWPGLLEDIAPESITLLSGQEKTGP
jgi:ABC-type nitrate/sulfonate/bicarbonate transport system substrate-binding protein